MILDQCSYFTDEDSEVWEEWSLNDLFKVIQLINGKAKHKIQPDCWLTLHCPLPLHYNILPFLILHRVNFGLSLLQQREKSMIKALLTGVEEEVFNLNKSRGADVSSLKTFLSSLSNFFPSLQADANWV